VPRATAILAASVTGFEARGGNSMSMDLGRLRPNTRFLSLAVAALMSSLTLAGCHGSNSNPSGGSPYGSSVPASVPPQRRGLSTGQKVAILAGAAALYYLYQHHKQAQGEGKQGQYYLSKNGRVYYRDPKTHQPIWVTPPPGGIQVPANEAQQYSQYQGYNNQPSGDTFGGYGATAQPAAVGPPGPPGAAGQ
jgi:hypothetical protein